MKYRVSRTIYFWVSALQDYIIKNTDVVALIIRSYIINQNNFLLFSDIRICEKIRIGLFSRLI